MELIGSISPVAWQRVNLVGAFEFSQTGITVDIDALAAYYDDPAYWARILQTAAEPNEP
ncbi:hypothetical protein [Xanthomonas vasicola]|uniref:hypothetical protein n=1 Tax=Xanthomonas vasicola TaxID=56459 RepID=UPI0001CBFA87|nr:hypothetical protein [Xanthomonas vasicola]MBV6744645.1 hypothetical protein [Xanthomonas vasicola pv. vasculorum NCPPB 890]MBV6890258.1 hypothetical protein [Xanthomonas vasicola pv. vasculorum]MDO6946810.1 hypothetical protein [Xanthomonas vasicola]MDO6958873.1 hypothetical protein [Xanthomonas vasicola]MDO6967711.1 hypothetical protein [Xanthomonas vasicola]